MMRHLIKSEFERFGCRTWSVWYSRLRDRHCIEGQCKPSLKKWDHSYIEEYWTMVRDGQTERFGSENDSPNTWSWSPPLDVDAILDDKRNVYGVVGLIQNHVGDLVLAFGQKISEPISVVHAKLIGLKVGVQMIHEKGFYHVHVFSDSQMVCKQP